MRKKLSSTELQPYEQDDDAHGAGEFVLRRLPSISAGVEEVLLLDSSAGMLDRARRQRVITSCWARGAAVAACKASARGANGFVAKLYVCPIRQAAIAHHCVFGSLSQEDAAASAAALPEASAANEVKVCREFTVDERCRPSERRRSTCTASANSVPGNSGWVNASCNGLHEP